MPDHDKIQRKTSEKKPTAVRLEAETADKLRELCKDFANQDLALNTFMAAYERETLISAQPQFAEDVRQFEQYQQCLSAKYADMLKALATADVRAKTDVRQLLDSKDATILNLQKQAESAQSQKQTYENLLNEAVREKNAAEKKQEEERLISQGLRAEMKEKEAHLNSSLQDKIQLNDILTQTIAEKQAEIDKLSSYPSLLQEKEKQLQAMSGKIRDLEDQLRDNTYNHRLELLNLETKLHKESAAQISTLQENYEARLEKLREKIDAAQVRIQELMSAGK